MDDDLINIMKDLLDEFRKLAQTLNLINFSLKLLVQKVVESRLSQIFTNNKELLIYKLTDGKNTTSEISKHVGLSTQTISNIWQAWEDKYGIVETKGYRNPYKAKYSLEELALIFGESQKSNKIQDKEGN